MGGSRKDWKRPSEREEAKPVATKGGKPACFGDGETFSPRSAECKGCPESEECKAIFIKV